MARPIRPTGRPLVHRDAEGRQRPAATWESLTERLIREAQDAGRFDDLPGHGRPLHLEDDHYAGDMALAHHVLRGAGAVPPWIEADKEVRRLQVQIERLLQRARSSSPRTARRLPHELEQLADRHEDAVRRLEGLAPTPRQQRPRLDRESLRGRLAAALADRGQDR